jgi:hypothetical protein
VADSLIWSSWPLSSACEPAKLINTQSTRRIQKKTLSIPQESFNQLDFFFQELNISFIFQLASSLRTSTAIPLVQANNLQPNKMKSIYCIEWRAMLDLTFCFRSKFPYFEKINEDLWDHLTICRSDCVFPPYLLKVGTVGALFLCMCISSPIFLPDNVPAARQRLGKRIVERVVFYPVRIVL